MRKLLTILLILAVHVSLVAQRNPREVSATNITDQPNLPAALYINGMEVIDSEGNVNGGTVDLDSTKAITIVNGSYTDTNFIGLSVGQVRENVIIRLPGSVYSDITQNPQMSLNSNTGTLSWLPQYNGTAYMSSSVALRGNGRADLAAYWDSTKVKNDTISDFSQTAQNFITEDYGSSIEWNEAKNRIDSLISVGVIDKSYSTVVEGLVLNNSDSADYNTSLIQQALDCSFTVFLKDTGRIYTRQLFVGNNVLIGKSCSTELYLADSSITSDTLDSFILPELRRRYGRRPDTIEATFTSIQNLTINGNASMQSNDMESGILLWSINAEVLNCHVMNCRGEAIEAYHGDHVVIKGSKIDSIPIYNVDADKVQGAISINGVHDERFLNKQTTEVIGNIIKGNTSEGGGKGSRGIFVSGNGNQVKIDQNYIQDCGNYFNGRFARSIDLYRSGDHTVISNNKIINRRYTGISVANSTNVTVVNNTIDSVNLADVGNLGAAINFNTTARGYVPDSYNLLIDFNHITNQGGADNGITLVGDATYPIKGVKISDNDISDVYDGIFLTTTEGVSIRSNSITSTRDGIRFDSGLDSTAYVFNNEISSGRIGVYLRNSTQKGNLKFSGNTVETSTNQAVTFRYLSDLNISSNSINRTTAGTEIDVLNNGNVVSFANTALQKNVNVSANSKITQLGDNFDLNPTNSGLNDLGAVNGDLLSFNGTDWDRYTQVVVGSGTPATTPTRTGQIYVDNSGGSGSQVIYMAAGTSSSSDWIQISN